MIGWIALGLVAVVSSARADGPVMDLDTFLKSVKESNQGYRASVMSSDGALERSEEGDLLYSPQFFSDGQYVDDRRPTLAAAFQGNQTETKRFAFGFSKQTAFGFQSKLYYGVNNATISGASPQLVPQPNFYESGLNLELSQSLVRNGFGRSVRAMERAVESQAKAVSYGEAFKAKMTLAEAESRYWRLAIAQEVIRVQKESLDRAVKIRDLHAKRVDQGLADRADLLQSEAAVKTRRLQLGLALGEERTAKRAFNSARGVDSDDVRESLRLPDPTMIEKFQTPQRVEQREDIKSAEEQMKASTANYVSARDKQLPVVDLFANGSLNGRNADFNDAAKSSITSDFPYGVIGLRVMVPLDFGSVSAVRSGYLKEIHAAELTYQRRLFEQESDWKNLEQSLTEARARLTAELEVENAQFAKLELEKKRQQRGQSTTFQVFAFEQEYLGSQISRIQTQGIILNLLSQMKTYRGEL